MSIIYFDICAIPLFLMILFISYSRKMTKGNANQLFITVVALSLFSTIADLGVELANAAAPLSGAGYVLCGVSIYLYLTLRNATNAVLLLFLLALTRTTFLLRRRWAKVLFCLPYCVILMLLAQNPLTHSVFTVTAEHGYARARLILVFYAIALVYGLAGFAYCIYSRRYLPKDKWVALLSVYLLAHLAVVIQFLRPELLVEMFCTALAEMIIMLTIMRPEERMDSDVGMLSWASYQSDIRNIILSGEHVQIFVIRMRNCREIRNYLGDHKYDKYLSGIADGIRTIRWKRHHRMDLYYEQPGTIYLILNADGDSTEDNGVFLLSKLSRQIKSHTEMGARFEPQVCLIRCPNDLQRAEDVISLGHKFYKIDMRKQAFFRASEMIHSQTFAIETHIEEILDRAIRQNHIEMYYQPIYDIHSGCFHSAEALARIIDPEYGVISPAIFIPAAETLGYIVQIGDAVLEQVYRFISEHDLNALGLSYIEINLSVAQCMESNLPEKILALQQKYGVDPRRVNLEITETTFEGISETMADNVNKLIEMGYTFALDDYGTGYSSIQRVNHIPLKLIKIDKSMLEEVSSVNGRMILEHTVRMMQSIGKQLVAEGAETRDEVELLENMNCDYIQGYFFSRPLPEADFVHYLEQKNAG